MHEISVGHVDVAGGAIAYGWLNGPSPQPLLMLHGLGDSAIHTFSTHIANGPLASTPLLLVDLPGFGESHYTPAHPATIARYATDVAALLDSLGITRIPVFGHSMGGNVAIHLADQYPDRISHLVVAEPLLDPTQSILASGIASVTEETFVARRYAMLVRATSLQAHRGDRAAAAYLEPLRASDAVAMHRAARSLVYDAAPHAEYRLANLPIPRTVLVGERTVADTQQLEMAAVSVVRIANAGHFMMVDEAYTTGCAILKAITFK